MEVIPSVKLTIDKFLQSRKAFSGIFLITGERSMLINLSHFSKTLAPIEVTLSGNLTNFKLLHDWNTAAPISTSESGNVIDSKFTQLAKVRSRRTFKLLGKFILVNSTHFSNAPLPMSVTVFGMEMLPKFGQL